MKKKYLLLFILFFLYSHFYSKAQSNIQGIVLDKTTKKPLPFVNIILGDGPYGTTSAIDGTFSLKVNQDVQKLTFSYVGYENFIYPLLQDNSKIIIYLEEKNTALSGVTITVGENPAIAILKKVVANRKRNDPDQLKSFAYQNYLKVWATASKSNLKDSITTKMDSLLAKQHFFVSETVSERLFLAPSHNQEKVIAHQLSGFKTPFFAVAAQLLRPIPFYKDYISLSDKNYLNPASAVGMKKYFFAIEDTLLSGKDSTFVISFLAPKHPSFEAVEGILYINSYNYAIQNIIISPTNPAAPFAFKIQQQCVLTENFWFPEQLSIEITANSDDLKDESGSKFIVMGHSFISKVKINPSLRSREFDDIDFEILPTAIEQPQVFWDSIRIEKLDAKEQKTYQVLDSIGRTSKLYLIPKVIKVLTFRRLSTGILDFPFKYWLDFNPYEGIRLGLGIYTNYKLSNFFTIGGYGAYGTKDKAFKYGGSGVMNLYPRKSLQLGFHYQQDILEVGQNATIQNEDITLINNHNNLNTRGLLSSSMDSMQLKRVALSYRPTANWLFTSSFSQMYRNPTYAYQFITKKNGALIEQAIFNFTEAQIGFLYQYKTKFIKIDQRKLILDYRYPLFHLSFSKGLPNFLQGEFDYLKVDFLLHHQFYIGKFGRADVRLQGGTINGSLPYSSLYTGSGSFNGSIKTIFNSGNIPLLADYTFQTMGLYEFTSSQYASIFFKHNFGKLYQTPVSQPELVLVQNAGWGRLNNLANHIGVAIKTLDKGFFESGIQFDKLFISRNTFFNQNFGVGLFYRYGANQNPILSDNLVLKFSINSIF